MRNRGKIAGRSIEHLLNRRPDLKKSLNRLALLKMHSDLTNSIAHLSGSIVAEDPDLFYDHIKWTENYYRHRGVKPGILVDQLEALLKSIREFELLDSDNTASGIIYSGIEWLGNHRNSPTTNEEIPVSPEGLEYAAILLDGDELNAENYINELIEQKWAIEEIITDVMQPALYEV
ncbi:MAG: hypothetical protein EA364_04265, partial [Balneolaceae bacterium]